MNDSASRLGATTANWLASLARPAVARIASVYAVAALLMLLPWAILGVPMSGGQLASVVEVGVFLLVIAFGQGIAILLGGLDLSIGVVASLSGVMVASLGSGGDVSLIYSIPAVLLLTASVGFINGVGIEKLGVPPFIMTLASGIMTYSLMLGVTGGSPSGTAPDLLQSAVNGSVFGVSGLVIFAIVFAALGYVLLDWTVFGRRLHAIGTSRRAAYLAGLPVGAVTIAGYTLSAASGGIAGIMLAGYSGTSTLTMADSYLFPSIAAVVVGGSSILGGQGSYIGTAGGVLLLGVLTTVMMMIGLDQGWRFIIQGSVIIIALLVQFRDR